MVSKKVLLEKRIDQEKKPIEEDFNIIVQRLSFLFIEINNMDEKNENMLLNICKYKQLNTISIQKIDNKYKELKNLLFYFINKKKETDLYVKTNFNSNTIKRVVNKEINSLENLIEAIIKIKKEKWLKKFTEKLEEKEEFKDIVKTIKMSDVITQALFVKLLIPNMIAAGLSNEEIREIFNTLKNLAVSKPNHKEFYEVFESLSLCLSLFGYNKTVFDYLRCLK